MGEGSAEFSADVKNIRRENSRKKGSVPEGVPSRHFFLVGLLYGGLPAECQGAPDYAKDRPDHESSHSEEARDREDKDECTPCPPLART